MSLSKYDFIIEKRAHQEYYIIRTIKVYQSKKEAEKEIDYIVDCIKSCK